jgi:hypothetical protein
VVLIGLLLVSVLGLHWLWLSWRVQRLSARLQAPVTAPAEQEPPLTATDGQQVAHTHTAKLAGLSDIHALTAQKHPVTLEERLHEESDYVPSTLLVSERLDPTFDPSEHSPLDEQGATPALEDRPAPPDSADAAASLDEAIFFKPPHTVLQAKQIAPQAPQIHPQFHYQARITWPDDQGKRVLADALQSSPWTQALPLLCAPDPDDDCSVIAAWQVVSRRILANASDAVQFQDWCANVAQMSAGRSELLSDPSWEAFLDTAHGLLIALDSVIVLKVSVPLVQMDLFAQSLIAARFTQSQEHWCYQEHEHSAPVYLERLWQQANADGSANQQAVFQLMIDIPHLDALEARKIYMRLRAVARTSAAIMQSAQGVHLSEGMLDRYSRELMLKQDALNQAKVPPGSALAQSLFKPALRLNSDLEISG